MEKLVIGLGHLLGFGTFLWSFFESLHDIKSAILFLIGAIYMGARTYFYIKREIKFDKMRQLKIREKEIELNAAKQR